MQPAFVKRFQANKRNFMYALYSLELIVLVYLSPAIALFPRLVLSGRTVVAIPFVSIAVIGLAKVAFSWWGVYTRPTVIAFSLLLTVIAMARLFLVMRNTRDPERGWPKTDKYLLLLCLIFGVYWAARLGTTGFDDSDEIYSWNMWALQHYYGYKIDYYYTNVPYPQLLPILISYCYKILGNVELQMPVRATFALFPITLWGAVAVAHKNPTLDNAIYSAIVMLVLAGAIGSHFSDGFADPLMASALIVSVSLLIQYFDNPDNMSLLVISVVCAVVAIFTKQAALIWGIFSFQAIAMIAIARGRIPAIALLPSLALLCCAIYWAFVQGSGFENNHGVISRSFQDRSAIAQLFYGFYKRLVVEPLDLLMLLAGASAVIRARKHVDILVLFVIPATIAWLLFGAYGGRLGMHIIALGALLFAALDYSLPTPIRVLTLEKGSAFFKNHRITVGLLLVATVLFGSVYRITKNVNVYGNDFSLYASGKNTIHKYFGADSGFVYDELYNQSDILLWIPSNYIYGIFYGHTPIVRPASWSAKYTKKDFINDVYKQRPDFLLYNGAEWDKGAANRRLYEVATGACSNLFERVTKPNNGSEYVVYRLRKNSVLLEECRARLRGKEIR